MNTASELQDIHFSGGIYLVSLIPVKKEHRINSCKFIIHYKTVYIIFGKRRKLAGECRKNLSKRFFKRVRRNIKMNFYDKNQFYYSFVARNLFATGSL